VARHVVLRWGLLLTLSNLRYKDDKLSDTFHADYLAEFFDVCAHPCIYFTFGFAELSWLSCHPLCRRGRHAAIGSNEAMFSCRGRQLVIAGIYSRRNRTRNALTAEAEPADSVGTA